MEALVPYASAAVTGFTVLVLARAAWHKASAYHETVGFAQGYGLVPAAWTYPIVRALTAAEILAIALMFLPATRASGGLLAAGLFAGYGVLMGLALRNGRSEIDCGCGGAPQVVSGLTLGRNALLSGLALGIALIPAGPVGVPGALVSLAAGLTFFAVYGVAEKLASHLPNIRRTA
ncbi:MauE/DoxX family redox-associated membrane protein [Mangrovicoccus sp. HB161399]|uniref:MauE/DoxX family redox-associated membrane protein n=1 Tax=Mangrovicoccus sp. HB161399 TaxID=2720392 RepID=UPI0015548DE6|nr:MauE/DoxX family redox-associated membrane protein [Mangrovicoccus sp. HB161399]